MRWQLLDAYAPYLSKAFVDEDFRMTSALTGAEELQPRWLRVLHAEDQALGFAIGEIYVTQEFPPRRQGGGERAWSTRHPRGAARRISPRSPG